MQPHSRTARLTFRVFAIGLGLMPLLATECILATLNLPDREASSSLLDEFIAVRPLFVLDPQSDRMRVADNRLEYFQSTSFPSVKQASDRRVFVLGGSTVQGRPYGHQTAFAHWLEQSLSVGDSRYQWQVINCGGVSYASYRLSVVLAEVLRYQPDLIILYCGNNEYLERRSLPPSSGNSVLDSWFRFACQLRTVHALSNVAERDDNLTFPPTRSSDDESGLSESDLNRREVNALLDDPDGLNAYQFDQEAALRVTVAFQRKLDSMVQQCKHADVPILLISPAVNLADCAPFKSNGDLSAPATFESLSLAERMAILQLEREQEPQSAAIAFRLASVQNELGRSNEALLNFQAACDLDLVPLRATSAIRSAISRSAESLDVPLIDAHELLASKSRRGILGRRWMADHVHPSIAGHQQIAYAIVDELKEMNLIALQPSWRSDAEAAFKSHLLKLDETYYARGDARLEALEAWARGRQSLPSQ